MGHGQRVIEGYLKFDTLFSSLVNKTIPYFPPLCLLTAPSTGAFYLPSTPVTITARATAYNGGIKEVVFFKGADSVSTASSAPYTCTLTGLAAGSYLLTARAVDESGTTATSAPVTITIADAVNTSLSKNDWTAQATSSNGPEIAANAIDKSTLTRWCTGIPQASGQALVIDMKSVKTVTGITLISANNGYPREYQLYIAADTAVWNSPVVAGKGRTDRIDTTFLPVSGRYLKIVQTGTDTTTWWSVNELMVSGANGTGIMPDNNRTIFRSPLAPASYKNAECFTILGRRIRPPSAHPPIAGFYLRRFSRLDAAIIKPVIQP